MILEPVKASGWLSTDLSIDERGILKRSGIVPINDKLFPYWPDKSKIQLYYGGRGGGKSIFIFQKLVNQCRQEKYFKCFYGRKVFDTLRESCYQTLISVIDEMGLSDEFDYSDAKEGSMKVVHIETGNCFIPFGSDKAKKLKSLKDPTVIYCEEFEEFEFEDFKELLPTLRTEKAQTQFIAAFNTHNIFPESSWIIKVFFPDIYNGKEAVDRELLRGIDIKKVFINYPDNYFIDHEQYSQNLYLAAGGNMLLFEAMANGAWGATDNKQPWLYAFDYEKHVSEKAIYAPGRPVYLAFDFNNDPIACTAWQFCEPSPAHYAYLHCIGEFVGSFKIPEICQRIRTKYPNAIFYVTGDRSGKNKQLQGYQTLYDIIGSLLNINKRMINAPDFNLRHTDSRALCNMMFANYPKLLIHPSCNTLINDCQIATIDPTPADGNRLRKDREGYKMDAFDSMRYLLQTYFFDFVKKEYLSMAK